MQAREIISQSKRAEKNGFDSLWISEDPYLRDAVPLATLMAISTKKAIVGTGILNIYTKHPVYLAMAAATLNEISSGRLCLGIGRGVRSLIGGELHIRYGSYFEYTKEYLVCLRKLLSGEEVTYAGKEIKITKAKLHTTDGHRFPILLGAIGPKMLELAGCTVDGVLLNSCTSINHVKLASSAIEVGRKKASSYPDSQNRENPLMAASLLLSIDDDKEKAYRNAKISVAFILSIPSFGESYSKINNLPTRLVEGLRVAFRWDNPIGDPTWHLENADLGLVEELVDDGVVDLLAVCGSIEDCRNRVNQYFRAGITTAVLNPVNQTSLRKAHLLLE